MSGRPLALLTLLSAAAVSFSAADDPYGDPIPEGARARLGTNRMRITSGGPTTITPDGKYLVGQAQGGMAYFESATGKVARTVRVDAQFSTLVGFSADGKRAVNTSYDSTLVWDTASGKVLATVKRFGPGGDGGVSISSDGKRLAMGGSRRDKEASATAVVWDVDGNKALATVTPVQNETVYVALSPDGKRLATWGSHFDRAAKERPRPEADPARQVQFWDAATGKETGKVHVPGGYSLTAVSFAPDGALAAASAGEGAVYLFDPAGGAAKGVLLGRARQGRKLAFSPDGKTLASIGDDGGIQRWSVADGTRRDMTEPPAQLAYGVRGLVFADNERVIAWTMRGVAALAWEAPSGKLLTPPGGHAGAIRSAAFSSDGKEILTASADGAILRWDATGGKELGAIKLKPPGSTGCGLSPPATLAPTGMRALTAESGGLAIYNLPSGTQAFIIPGEGNRENRGTFSADGTKVAQVLGTYDPLKEAARVSVWDVASAKRLVAVELPGIAFPQAVVTPDGKTLVTAGQRRDAGGGEGAFAVTRWDVATGKKRGEVVEASRGGFGSGFIAVTAGNTSILFMRPEGGMALVDFTSEVKVSDLDRRRAERSIAAPVVSPDGKTAVAFHGSGYDDSRVVLIDLESGKEIRVLSGISGRTTLAVFAADGKTLVTGSQDTTALVWDVSR